MTVTVTGIDRGVRRYRAYVQVTPEFRTGIDDFDDHMNQHGEQLTRREIADDDRIVGVQYKRVEPESISNGLVREMYWQARQNDRELWCIDTYVEVA